MGSGVELAIGVLIALGLVVILVVWAVWPSRHDIRGVSDEDAMDMHVAPHRGARARQDAADSGSDGGGGD